jgi:hypothetical protein
MCLEVRQAVSPEVVAHAEVLADRQADGRCSCARYGGYEPSIL